MKLRINNQSIRLRLSQKDIVNLGANNNISEPLYWGPQENDILVYKLTLIKEGLSQVKITSKEINVMVLKSEITALLTDEEMVSFEFCLATHSGPLMVLIERDFKCLTPRNENEDGLFENPNEKC